MKFLALLTQILEAIANVLNMRKKKKYTDDPAGTVANGGRVQQSSKSFSDLADEVERDKPE